jgi:hypothetical protein
MKWYVKLNRDIETTVGHLIVTSAVTGRETAIAPPTTFVQRAGVGRFASKKAAQAFCKLQREAHGQDVCSDPYCTLEP